MVTTTLTIQDILPYGSNRSTAKKVDMDAILPYIILPVLLLIASISPAITITIMVFIGMAALYVHSRPRAKNRSPFFFSWTISSGVTMFIVFEFGILPLLEITQLENFIFLTLLACTCYFFYKMKAIADFELATGTSKGKEYSPVLTADSHYCQICQIEVNDKFFHSIWWDCCILRPNYIHYLAGHSFALATLVFGANLGMTTLCQPINFHGVLLPQNCNDVYYEFSVALSFVTCVYGIGYSIVIFVILIHQVLCNFIPRYSAVAAAGQAVELVDGVGIFIITSFVLFSILFKIGVLCITIMEETGECFERLKSIIRLTVDSHVITIYKGQSLSVSL